MNKFIIARILATWFYSGYLKPAPGTWGTLAAIPLCLLSILYFNITTHIGITVALILIGLWATKIYQNQTGKHDSSEIVIDEVAGMMIAVLPLFVMFDWGYLVVCFVLVRIFDAVKIGIVGWLDKNITGAWGVMLDDIAAGLLTSICILGYMIWMT